MKRRGFLTLSCNTPGFLPLRDCGVSRRVNKPVPEPEMNIENQDECPSTVT